MKVDYLFEEMKGMKVEEAIDYLHSLFADEGYDSHDICYPSESEEVFRLLLANSWYLNKVKKDEMEYDFLILEGKNPDTGEYYEEDEAYYYEEEEDYLDDYDKALREVKEQEDKAITEALETMMAEAQDRNAAESYIKYRDILPVHNWSTYTKYVNVFWGVYKNEFFNAWSFRYDMYHSERYFQDWQELDEQFELPF